MPLDGICDSLVRQTPTFDFTKYLYTGGTTVIHCSANETESYFLSIFPENVTFLIYAINTPHLSCIVCHTG